MEVGVWLGVGKVVQVNISCFSCKSIICPIYLCTCENKKNMCLTCYFSNMTILFSDEGCNNIELKNTSLEMKDNEL